MPPANLKWQMIFLSAAGVIDASQPEIAMNSAAIFRTILWICYSIYFPLRPLRPLRPPRFFHFPLRPLRPLRLFTPLCALSVLCGRLKKLVK